MFEDDSIQKKINNEDEIDKAILVGLDWNDKKDFSHSLYETTELIEACDMEVVEIIVQKLPHPDAATYIGKGKVHELAQAIEDFEAEYCIFEGNLSPAQLKNLQNIIKVPIWDKTNLILEIFSRRAKTREAKLQVESAYLQFMLPRLSGMWQHLGRQSGGSGSKSNKGIGETQIELDRRQINKRIVELNRELETLDKTRSVQRSGRRRGGVPRAALVGYTNAGKSTILNRMLTKSSADEEKMVFEKDMLFATLDTSIRYIKNEDNRDFLLSDTVGFIEDLPTSLIKAFRSTLQEASDADLLLIVLDASDRNWQDHKKVTEDTLRELGATDIPKIYVMNKSDLIIDRDVSVPKIKGDEIWISAGLGEGIPELASLISDRLYSKNKMLSFLLPYNKGDLLDKLHRQANILKEEYTGDGILFEADCPCALAGEIEKALGLVDPDTEEW